jgi:hypothetical protein
MPETIDALVQKLSSKDRTVRRSAEDALAAMGPQTIDHLLPCLRGGQPTSLRLRAESVLNRLREEALPRLREIRREGPGQLRSKALEKLVDLGGVDALDEADRRAVERLVHIKLLDEHQVETPLEAGRWLAFPANRLEDTKAAFGLHDLRPVTSVLGVAAATQATDFLDFQDSQGQPRRAYRVFVTPEFENPRPSGQVKNWRMLWGNSFLDELDGFELARELSERCGEAHFYVLDPYNASESWYVARDGHAVRSYGTYADPQFDGEPLPFEAGYMEGDEECAEGVPDAFKAADNLSVHPGPQLAKFTYGHGWLATTHPDIPNSRFKGALPI